MLILSETQIQSLPLDAAIVTDALAAAFRLGDADAMSGLKTQLSAVDGGYVQALPAVLATRRRAAVKWVNVAGGANAGPRIRACILLSDAGTGEPLALLAASHLTAIRTAAMSALAARHLMRAGARTIGFLGCGAQAQAHLDTFVQLFPTLDEVVCYAPSSRDRVLGTAARLGIAASALPTPEAVAKRADVLISSVPARPDGNPAEFDAGWLGPGAFASLVDLGRPWIPLGQGASSATFTDYIPQSEQLMKAGKMSFPAGFAADLYGLAHGAATPAADEPRFFVFGGLGMCDAVVADMVFEKARAIGLGTTVALD